MTLFKRVGLCILFPTLLSACAAKSVGVVAPVTPPVPSVHFIYAVPNDVTPNPLFDAALTAAENEASSYFTRETRRRFVGLTVERQVLPNTAAFYSDDSWPKIAADIVHNDVDDYIVYADVTHACEGPGRLGAALPKMAILGRSDVLGLLGEHPPDDCGNSVDRSSASWLGGLMHEMGHSFGLSHPPGCDDGEYQPCDSTDIMWLGYLEYPNADFNEQERAALATSPFLK